jgi:Fe-Mn family superoxide dismutase
MHKLPELPYPYNSLEPYIDEETMVTHHTKHHQGYVNKLNSALEKHPDLFDRSLEDLLINLNEIPEDIRTSVRNNGGGHYAHSLFWSIMSPNPDTKPNEETEKLITDSFGSLDKFREEFTDKASKLFGSGWVWLVKEGNDLEIVETSGHDVPISEIRKPVMVIDVWEHAYYLKYKNKRADFINNWWNILDWSKI